MVLYQFCSNIGPRVQDGFMMILKFHMQLDKAAGPQKNKIQAARESNMAAVARNSETTEINLSS